jgi:putative thiamine transport system permease protein
VARVGHTLQALYIPLLVPQIAFLFGLQVLFSFAGLDGTFVAVLLVHLVFVFPYVLLSLSDPWRSWDPRYGQLVRALGRGPDAIFWRVRLPMLLRPVLTAAALGFAISVGLYLPTLLIGAGRWPTVTTETVALASGGDRKLIGATALVQALLPFLGFAVAALVPAIIFRNRRLLGTSP